MILQNLHTHTIFDDGKNTPEQMIQAALDAGLDSVGISVHSPLPFNNDWCVPSDRVGLYIDEMSRLKKLFGGKITVYTGIEWDIISKMSLDGFDYVIGSVHHMPFECFSPTVDESRQTTAEIIKNQFGGDSGAMAAAYFEKYSCLAENNKVDIVAHFDLITKFDDCARLFDENSPAYRTSALKAMRMLVEAGKIFEINTGAVSRGYRKNPYPSKSLLCELNKMGGKIIIASDAHSVNTINCGFDDAVELAKSCGFSESYRLEGKEFVPVKL